MASVGLSQLWEPLHFSDHLKMAPGGPGSDQTKYGLGMQVTDLLQTSLDPETSRLPLEAASQSSWVLWSSA